MSLDGFSMHRLTRELDRELSGGRVDKITQPNRTTIQISIPARKKSTSLYFRTFAESVASSVGGPAGKSCGASLILYAASKTFGNRSYRLHTAAKS